MEYIFIFLFLFQGFERVSSRKQVIGVIFHGNDIAREMKLRHFRNNVELPWIDSDKNYDSFYQSVRLFEQPVTIENQVSYIFQYISECPFIICVGEQMFFF